MRSLLVTVAVGMILGACQHGHKHGHKHEGHEDKMAKKWEMMDTNKDGAVSKDEFHNAHMEKFKKMDANSDGKVTKEEKMAFKKAQMEEKKASGDKGCCS